MYKPHTFHIPVMGIGYTIDTPLKVAPLGIDSVISLVDDMLIEKMRKVYCDKFDLPYKEITEQVKDFRAKRITSYLNLINKLAKEKFEVIRNASFEKHDELKKYLRMLPENSALKKEFDHLSQNIDKAGKWLKEHLSMGSIDVNIMTKLDKENYLKGEKLPQEYNDAHAALRGFAESDLSSSLILSAGMNPRLYGYMEHFKDFYPDESGNIKKKIVLKVSDFRSALIQGKFLAKKGLWVSEFRIESGLNCGGHAFATEGFLIGPILNEFKEKREELIESTYKILVKALEEKSYPIPNEILPMKISAQGGVGTAEEHEFLLDHYQVDSVGWGTPFLLVPEAVSIDDETLNRLEKAKEKDLYLSNISPLGVPFNNLKGNTKDEEKLALIEKDRPGSSCPKKYVALNTEFSEKPICTASRQYQYLKLIDLEKKNLPKAKYQKAFREVVEKSCICVGLGTSALLVNNVETKTEGKGVSVCPGPNMAYFSKVQSLEQMVDHIYGRKNVIKVKHRPNMYIKELQIYINYLKDKVESAQESMMEKQKKGLETFAKNLTEGIHYYQDLFSKVKGVFEDSRDEILGELEKGKRSLEDILSEIKGQELKMEKVIV